MPVKCDSCGVETNLAETFFKERRPFSVQTYCPACWLERQHSTFKRVFFFNLGLGVAGLLFWFALGEGHLGINLLFFQIFLTLTILPHELGHAWMARWLGMRVFKIYLGSGRTAFTFRLFGFDFELRPVPIGGVVRAAHRSIECMALKQFAFVLAGPAVNFLLAAAIWLLLDSGQLWSFRPMVEGLHPELMFFYANLAVLLVNLWPHNVATEFGPLPSDGKNLLLAPFLSREKRELQHAESFLLEAAVYYQQGNSEGAQRWVEKGLALYPDNEMLLDLYGVVAIDLGEYDKARECFLGLLHRASKQPLMRPLTLNNIAYANAFLGGDDLLKEADAFSLEAMAAIGWMPAIMGTRGTVLAKMGRFEEALPLLNEAMSKEESPNHKAQSACLIAETECRRGNLDVAWTYLKEARRLDPKCSLLSRAEAALRGAAMPTV
jgi:tetratricopeptide (TPR) repeat protein